MSVTVDQIIKLYVAGLLSGTGTQGDPIILDDLPANTVIGDLGGGTGAITIDQLKTALNLGGGNAGVRPLNVIVATGDDTIDLEQWAFDYWQIDLSAVSAETIDIINPLNTAVPLIHIHFINLVGDVDVTFPSQMRDANGDALGTHTFTQGQIVPFYYSGGNYYTNYLNAGGGSGGGSVIVQDPNGVPLLRDNSGILAAASLAVGPGLGVSKINDVITITRDDGALDADYNTIVSYANGNTIAVPSGSIQQKQSALVADLKAAGLWDKVHLMYVFTQGQAGLDDFSILNWKDPGNFTLIISDGLGPVDFNAAGVTNVNGSNPNVGWLEVPFSQADLLSFGLDGDNAGVTYYMNGVHGGNVFGFEQANVIYFSSSSSSGWQRNMILTSGGSGDSDAIDRGSYDLDSKTITMQYKVDQSETFFDGSLLGVKANATDHNNGDDISAFTGGEYLYLLTRNVASGPVVSSQTMGVWILHDPITEAEHTDFDNALKAYYA